MGRRPVSIKRLRKEIVKSEERVAVQASRDFKRFVNLLPWKSRVGIAWKVLRGVL